MRQNTVLVVPATVPDAQVRRIPGIALDRPLVVSAEPAAVPVARAIRIVPDRPTVEQVEQLRRENAALRMQLTRVRSA